MRTRGNRGIIGPQTLVNTSGGSGVNSLHDEQQLASALSWPGLFPPPPTVGYLVVAGGGGGGSLMGGGGGAGGFVGSSGYAAQTGSGANYYRGSTGIAALTGDFTIEFWWSQTSSGCIFCLGSESTNRVQIAPGYLEIFNGGSGTPWTWTAGSNVWNHTAIVRIGTTVTIYENGTLALTKTGISAAFGNATNLYIGTRSNGNISNFTGKISDIRVLSGTGLYTANFTPPIDPLTAIANCVFLSTSSSTTLRDSSTSNVTMTTVGSPTYTAVAPSILTTGYSITPGSSITVTVGSGGSGSTSSGSKGISGSNSVFGTVTSTGGGGGGSNDSSASSTITPGVNGGSGGGGAGSAQSPNRSGGTGNTPSNTPSQGNNGGTGSNLTTAYGGGGGGGAGAVGGDGSGTVGGSGGIGVYSTISGSLNVAYAGGGGGGTYNSNGTAGAGGSGGGGAGTNNSTTATSGTTNTGGGGGGNGGTSAGGFTAGTGGSGVVIIRYLNTYANAVITTGSPTYSNTGGYKIYTFTGSGSITF